MLHQTSATITIQNFLIIFFQSLHKHFASSEDSKWQANIHGVEEHEAGGDWDVEVYYERIQKLGHGLQVSIINNFLTIVFKAGM
jgi:hypothetical protein